MSNRRRHNRAKVPPATGFQPESGSPPIRLWRFLGLFVTLLMGSLLLWHLVLLEPLLALSRGVLNTSFSLLSGGAAAEFVTVDSQGDWIVRAPVLFPEREVTRQAGLKPLGALAPREELRLFSLSMPIFWALALAASPGRRVWRVLAIGTAVLGLVAQLSLMLFLAYWIDMSFVVASSPVGAFLLRVAGYVTTDVIPYLAPVLLVIALDRQLRAVVFGEPTPQKRPLPAPQ